MTIFEVDKPTLTSRRDCQRGVSVAVFITLKGFRWCPKCQCGGEQGNFLPPSYLNVPGRIHLALLSPHPQDSFPHWSCWWCWLWRASNVWNCVTWCLGAYWWWTHPRGMWRAVDFYQGCWSMRLSRFWPTPPWHTTINPSPPLRASATKHH